MSPATGWILAAAVLVAGYGLVRIRTTASRRVVAVRRAVSWLVGIVCLALLALAPGWTKPRTDGVVLLTEGSGETESRELARRAGPAWRVFDLRGARADSRADTPFPEVEGASALAALALGGEGLPEPVLTVGWGLREWDWRRLGLTPSEVLPPGPAEGVLTIEWGREVLLGDPLELRARVRYPTPTTLRLLGPGGEEAVVEVPAGEERPVRLQARPRLPGRHLYTLREEVEGGVRERSVEVEVTDPAPPSVLWLENAPGFESRHLREWLGDLGAGVGLRSRISRDRYRVETLNLTDPPALGLLTPPLLERFDLVVIDSETWRRLVEPEVEALEAAISESGLGVLLRVEEAERELPWGFETGEIEANGGEEDAGERSMRPVWGDRATDVPPLEDSGVRFQRPEPGDTQETRAFVADRRDRPVGVWRPLGRGRVGALALPATYPWVLEGRGELHRALWSEIVSLLSRPAASDRWLLAPGPVLVDDPLEALLVTAAPDPAVRIEGPDGTARSLAPRQDPRFPARWRILFHPRLPGWHRLVSPAGSLSFHVEPPGRWIDWERARRLEATLAAAAGTPASDPPPAGLPLRLLLWAVGVGALAALWADERLGGG